MIARHIVWYSVVTSQGRGSLRVGKIDFCDLAKPTFFAHRTAVLDGMFQGVCTIKGRNSSGVRAGKKEVRKIKFQFRLGSSSINPSYGPECMSRKYRLLIRRWGLSSPCFFSSVRSFWRCCRFEHQHPARARSLATSYDFQFPYCALDSIKIATTTVER